MGDNRTDKESLFMAEELWDTSIVRSAAMSGAELVIAFMSSFSKGKIEKYANDLQASTSRRLTVLKRQVPEMYCATPKRSDINERYFDCLSDSEFRCLIDYERGCVADAISFFISVNSVLLNVIDERALNKRVQKFMGNCLFDLAIKRIDAVNKKYGYDIDPMTYLKENGSAMGFLKDTLGLRKKELFDVESKINQLREGLANETSCD